MEAALTISHVSKTYPGAKNPALKDVSLTIPSGSFFALLGVNGAGKTTLINIITGLVEASGGEVSVFDHSIVTNRVTARKLTGVVPQEFNFSIFEKVIDIVVGQAGYYGIPYSVAHPRAIKLLTDLWLGDKIQAVARTLSGWMKRRLMIARALVHEPKFLILDEPTAGVDVELRLGMWEYLKHLNTTGTTILLTTHYLEEVEQLCDRVAIIKDGTIVRNENVKELLRSSERTTYVVYASVDSTFALDNTKTPPYHMVRIDEHSFEITLNKGETLTQCLKDLEMLGLEVQSVTPKQNRMEELFIQEINS